MGHKNSNIIFRHVSAARDELASNDSAGRVSALKEPLLRIELVADGLACISGSIGSKNPSVKSGQRVRIELSAPGETLPIWYASALLTGLQEDDLKFEVNCPIFAFSAGRYACRVLLDNADLPEKGILIYHEVMLPIKERWSASGWPLKAKIQIESLDVKQNFLLKISGVVKNCGTIAWLNNNNEHPYRVGGVLIRSGHGKTPHQELRCDFRSSLVKTGREVPFSFTINLLECPAGEYRFYIDLVHEGYFWFSEIGGLGELIEFELPYRELPQSSSREHFVNPPCCYSTSSSEAKFVYIAPTLPLFDRSTGGKRLIDIFKILREQEIEVTLLYEGPGIFDSPEKYLRALEELGVKHFSDPLGYLSEHNVKFNLCVIGWYECASRLMSAVRQLIPGTKIAVDSIDIHWQREERSRGHANHASSGDPHESKLREIAAYSCADEVWVVSEDDQATLLAELPDVKTRIVGIPSERNENYITKQSGCDLLFVGGFAHPPNESAAIWCVEIVEAFRKRTGLDVTLKIVGADPPQSIKELDDGKSIIVTGFVESLDPYYQSARVVLAPLRYGSGVKGKICEAISRGVPVLTTAIGNEGLGLKDKEEILLAENTDDFVSILIDIYSSKTSLENLRERALAALLAKHGKESISRTVLPALVAPKVVIAIVSYNQVQLLESCLNSVFSLTNYPSLKVAVVSNGCTDGTCEMLHQMQAKYPELLDLYFNNDNQFYVLPNNYIIDKYPDSDVVLLNNDVEILHPGWLSNLVDAAYSAANVASAGGKVLDPRGPISEAGAEIYSSGSGRNMGRGSPANDPIASSFRYVGFVSGCLMYMRRDAIKKIGKLDPDFQPMYFEDVAWNYTAHINGLKTLYTPWARVVHHEGSSAGTDTSKGMKRYQEINREKFLRKFSGVRFEDYNS